MKRRHRVIQHVIRVAIPIPIASRFSRRNRPALLASRLSFRPRHGPNDPIARRR
jgi:hypothetical protein